jgi:hypothetical protein
VVRFTFEMLETLTAVIEEEQGGRGTRRTRGLRGVAAEPGFREPTSIRTKNAFLPADKDRMKGNTQRSSTF